MYKAIVYFQSNNWPVILMKAFSSYTIWVCWSCTASVTRMRCCLLPYSKQWKCQQCNNIKCVSQSAGRTSFPLRTESEKKRERERGSKDVKRVSLLLQCWAIEDSFILVCFFASQHLSKWLYLFWNLVTGGKKKSNKHFAGPSHDILTSAACACKGMGASSVVFCPTAPEGSWYKLVTYKSWTGLCVCPVVHSIVELLAFDLGTVGCYLVQLFTLFTLERINAALNANAAAFISFQGLKKPYNPILGETFRCCWLHPQTNSCTFYIAEQVRPVFELESINMCCTATTLFWNAKTSFFFTFSLFRSLSPPH